MHAKEICTCKLLFVFSNDPIIRLSDNLRQTIEIVPLCFRRRSDLYLRIGVGVPSVRSEFYGGCAGGGGSAGQRRSARSESPK